MNQFLSNKIIAGIVALALLVGVGVLVSSGDTSSTTRNAALVVATPCTKPGQVAKVSKQSVVCATTNTGSLWYATMKAKGKAQACKSPGAIRQKSNIVWVCGVIKKKKLWQATQPLTALAVEGDLPSTTPATPDTPVVADNAVLAEPAVIDTAATQTLAPAVPTALSLKTQPSSGVNAVALKTQPVVQLLDQRGASISTAGITITAVTDRTDVVLSGNTAITDATGRAIFKTLSLTGIMGDIALTFTAPRLGLEGVTSGNLVLVAGVATALVSDTTLVAVATGSEFGQSHQLHLEDSSGNVVAISGRDVVVSSSPPGLYGYLTVTTAKDGYVRFSKDLALTEIGTTTLTFTSGDLSTTSTVEVVPGSAQKLKITTEVSESATNNVAFAQAPVVQLTDAEGNNVTTAGITVTATITRGPIGATVTTPTLLNPNATTDKDGVATFTGLGIQGLIGTYKLGFTSFNGGVTKTSDKTVTLKSGDLKKLIVLTAAAGLVSNSTDGTWSLKQQPKIGLLDISNNRVTKSDVKVTAEVTGQGPTFSEVTDTQGEAALTDLTFSGDRAGDRKIMFTALTDLTLTAEIDLPFLTPVLTQALTLPTDKNTISPAFTLTAPTSNSNGDWTYTSSNEAIATVDSITGTVTLLHVAGEVTITATQEKTLKYASGAESKAKIVIARTPTVVNQHVAYPPTPFTTTSLEFKPTNLPTSIASDGQSSTGAWTYTSANEAIAIVTTTGTTAGTVTPRGVAGEVTITATQAQTPKYASVTSTTKLEIVRTRPTVSREVSYDFAINTYSFKPTNLPKSNSNGLWTYSSSSEAMAPVNATTGTVIPGNVGGKVTITATQAATPKYDSVTSIYKDAAFQTIIGKTGPGGGKVFYAAEALQPWGRYLEAAPNDYQVNGLRTPVKWGCEIYPLYSSSWSIGSGRVNTDRILAGCNNRDAAADVAKKYSTTNTPCAPGAAGQWFLPSSEELRQLVANKTAIGGFGDNDSYVSSTQDYYWPLLGTTYRDDIGSHFINSYFYVRPVRAFGPTSEFNGVCAIGADGPGGGKVFYVHPWGTFTSTGSNCGSTCRYLEVAPYVRPDWWVSYSEIARVAWCSWPPTRLGVTATGIGSGMTNTINARKTCTSGAIQVAADYNNGKDDWYLPSKDELYEMWLRRAVIGVKDGTYWSSSEYDVENAWVQFNNGEQAFYGFKGDTWGFLRPVRAF